MRVVCPSWFLIGADVICNLEHEASAFLTKPIRVEALTRRCAASSGRRADSVGEDGVLVFSEPARLTAPVRPATGCERGAGCVLHLRPCSPTDGLVARCCAMIPTNKTATMRVGHSECVASRYVGSGSTARVNASVEHSRCPSDTDRSRHERRTSRRYTIAAAAAHTSAALPNGRSSIVWLAASFSCYASEWP